MSRCIDESIDELAVYLGVGAEVAEMTRKCGLLLLLCCVQQHRGFSVPSTQCHGRVHQV